MNRLLMIIFTMAIMKIGFAQLDANPDLIFATYSHDFGEIKEDKGIVSFDFSYENKGKTPIVINSISVSCGCTTPQYTKKPILPGESEVIKISFNPEGRPGFFSKEIYVYTNNKKSVNVLTITGKVIPRTKTLSELYPVDLGSGIIAASSMFDFGNIAVGHSHTLTIDFLNNSLDKLAISPVIVKHPMYSAYIEPGVISPDSVGQIFFTIDLTNFDNYQQFSYDMPIVIDGEIAKKAIKVKALFVPDFTNMSKGEMIDRPVIYMPKSFYHFLSVKVSDTPSIKFDIFNEGSSDLKILKILYSGKCLEISLDKDVILSGESSELEVKLNAKKAKSKVNENIILITNDPQYPAVEVRVTANIIKEYNQ